MHYQYVLQNIFEAYQIIDFHSRVGFLNDVEVDFCEVFYIHPEHHSS